MLELIFGNYGFWSLSKLKYIGDAQSRQLNIVFNHLNLFTDPSLQNKDLKFNYPCS